MSGSYTVKYGNTPDMYLKVLDSYSSVAVPVGSEMQWKGDDSCLIKFMDVLDILE